MADVIREREVRETAPSRETVRETDAGASGLVWVVLILLIVAFFWWMFASGRFDTTDTTRQDTDQSPSVNIETQTPPAQTDSGSSGETSGTGESGGTTQ